MYNMNELQIVILKELINSKDFISSELLSTVLGTAPKTIRSNISVINEILLCTGCARINSKTGLGYYLEIIDNQEFSVFFQNFASKYNNYDSIRNMMNARPIYIMRKLLFSNEYVKVEDLAKDLFVSRVTLEHDLKLVKKILERYHLYIKKKPHYGIKLGGREIHMRIALADYMDYDEDISSEGFDIFLEKNIDPWIINDVIVRNLHGYDISIPNSFLVEITKILTVIDSRFKKGHKVDFDNGDIVFLKGTREYSCAGNIIRELNYEWDENELVFLTLMIYSRRTLSDDSELTYKVKREYNDIADQIIDWILASTRMDISTYPNLNQQLTLHLSRMICRLKYGIEVKEVGSSELKVKNKGYEYAIISCQYLEEEFSYKVSEAEIAYFSYSFYSQFLSISNSRKYKILVILTNGKSASSIFINNLYEKYSKYIELVDVIEYYQLRFTDQEFYDLVLTDMPIIKFEDRIPVRRVNYFLSKNDYNELDRFFINNYYKPDLFKESFHENLYFNDIDLKTKEEVIEFLVNEICDKYSLKKDVLNNILNCERFSSTELGSNTAIPNSLYPRSHKTIIAVGILKKPIIWKYEKVRLVMLVINGRNESIPFSVLNIVKESITDIGLVSSVINSGNYADFMLSLDNFIRKNY